MSETEQKQRIQFKRNKYDDFDINSCTHQLLKGEPFYDSKSHRFVIGDGTNSTPANTTVVVTHALNAYHVDTYIDGTSTTKNLYVGDVSIPDIAVQILPNFTTGDAGKVLMINSSGSGLMWGSVESSSVGKAIATLTLSSNLPIHNASGSTQNLNSVTCKISISNKASGDIITYKSLKIGTTGYGSTNLISTTADIITGENYYTISPAKSLSSATTIYASLDYNVSGIDKNAKIAITILFDISPAYFAVSDVSSVDAVTENIITSGYSINTDSKSASHEYIMNGQRAIYAYKSSLGNLSTIIVDNQTAINQLGAFTKKQMQINGNEYNVYIMNVRQDQTCTIAFS